MGRYDDLLNKLKKVIAPDKNLVESIYGSYDYDPDSLVSSKWGVLAATNKRIIIYKEDSNIDSFQFENISSIELEKNIEGYIIKILLTDGRKKSFEAIKEGDPKKLFDHINNKIKNNNSDIYDKIERIFELKEKGILTEEEFNKEKERLLNNKSNEISLKSENKLNKYTKNKQQTHITDSPAKKNNDDDDEKHNSKNINENFSREWEQCPRCGSNNTEKEPGFWGMTIRTGIGMAILLGVLSMLVPPVGILLGTRLGILAAAIAALSLFLGLISIINPDFKCKDCGANWNADKKNKSNKKKKKKINQKKMME